MVVPYLVVDDTDGRILAEVSSVEEALRLLASLESSERVSLIRLDSGGNSLAHADSWVAIRPLFG
jgi:hypothetical protein